eukprot:TRINITY_DN2139_c0_g1_i1.p1 TRINITY_DN2139_c0_g1~~TRINITY_DN2139_c0_g1_i1.p1  ORF type:complete len:294 (-),score=73.26 TRINITY_DN2139_c0_g1_i1:15-896(-)
MPKRKLQKTMESTIEYQTTQTGQENTTSPTDGSLCYVRYEARWLPSKVDTDVVVFDAADVVQFVVGDGSILEFISDLVKQMVPGQQIVVSTKCNRVYGSMGCPTHGVPPNADIEFTITLVSYEECSTTPDNMTIFELKEQGLLLKERGSEYVQKKQFDLARSEYMQTVQLFENLNTNEEEDLDIQLYLVPFYQNIALCELQLENYSSCLNYCSTVLDIDPTNGKAHYRMALAYEKSQLYKEAKWHYTESNKYMESKGTQKKIARMSIILKEISNRKSKNPYAGMFRDTTKRIS